MIRKIINYIIRNSYALWLGASLAMADLPLTDFRFWVVMIPTVYLVHKFNK